MEKSKTNRGFSYIEFEDRYGIKCSIQESSLATENAIWFGCNNADPKVIVPGKGWTKIDMPSNYVVNTRMHLTQDQVKELLPILQRFAETGEL